MERLWPGSVVYDQALKERAKTFHDPAIQTGVLVEDNTGPIRLNGGGKYVCSTKKELLLQHQQESDVMRQA